MHVTVQHGNLADAEIFRHLLPPDFYGNAPPAAAPILRAYPFVSGFSANCILGLDTKDSRLKVSALLCAM